MQTSRPVTKPSKQRKAVYQAPAHIRHRLLAAHLSPQLRASHLIKNLPLRTGDTVKVMRGDHKNVEGKISRVDLGKYRVYVEGLTREKVDGTTILVPVHPSKVMITRLNLDDKWRREIVEAKTKSLKKHVEVEEKPKAKLAKVEEAVEIEEAKETVEEFEEKPQEVAVVEKAKEALEEKPIVEAKPAKKRAAKSKKRPAKKEIIEETKPKTKVEETEKIEKPKGKKKPKPTTKKTSKKTKEGEE
jgi:large subunit ribosomal protein L24